MCWPNSEELVKQFEQTGKPVLLSFSGGKDAVAAWLKVRGRVEVIPFFLYLIPELGFVERTLVYYEEFFGQKIHRYPNPSLYRMLNNLVYQPPERCWKIAGCYLPNFSHDELRDRIVEDLGLAKDTWTFSGVRSADSLNRRASMQKYGPLNHKRKMAHIIWDMRKDELIETLKMSGVKLSADYAMFGRSFDGIDYRFVAPVKKHFPEDYEKILEWFPLLELEMMRYEQTT